MPFVRRSCPNCGTPVGARRYWLLNWWGDRWACPGCSHVLKFSTRRKILVAVLNLPVMAAYAYALVTHEWWVAVVAIGVGALVASLDTVELADGVRGDGVARVQVGRGR